MLKVLCLSVLALASALQCPDGGMCADDNTCCKTPSGGYGCCPLPNAVCCSDHLHCCFEGTICDLVHSKCLNGTAALPWLEKVPVSRPEHPQGLSCADGKHCCPEGYECSDDGSACTRHAGVSVVGAVICPDEESECPDETTCCQLPDGSWGCCPMVKAVCCDDKVHCCPEGTRCDIAHSKCVSHERETPMWGKLPARKRADWENDKVTKVESVACPDGKSQCPDGTTCCRMPSGQYGCCPLPNAVCCSDHEHCCPAASTCDLKHDMLTKVESVACPDGKSQCPDGTTCCRMPSGQYGCCPLPNAVCCSDHEHCCPAASTCDLKHDMCTSANGKTPLLKKFPAIVRDASGVQCDDTSACADGSTCCMTRDGGWACCPLPKAECCNDSIHCCPNGYTCNVPAASCQKGALSFSWVSRIPVMKKASRTGEGDVKCDDITSCTDGTTCCRNEDRGWGCCPYPKAVCCGDHEHCCPEGTVCDLAAGTCNQGGFSVPWLEKIPVRTSEPNEEKCDDQTSCPDGSTCCKLSTGDWACCPLPRAVCCADREHCCPEGTTCDTEHKKCVSAEGETTMSKKFPAVRKNSNTKAGDVECDYRTACPDGTTCCKTASGSWTCCPLLKAVCCGDHEHCCPEGTVCDLAAGTCDQGGFSVPWLEKIPVRTSEPNEEKCDDQTSCPDGSTCCKLSTGDWACCPLPRAVCCQDGSHCCPSGYTCDVTQRYCQKGGHTVPWFSKVAAFQNSPSLLDVKCDPHMSCAAGSTCCKLPTGKWGCCPVIKAVCCEDQEHCCPQGYQCNMKTSTCERQSLVLPWVFQKAPLYSLSAATPDSRGNDMCDDQHYCSGQQTCCKTAAGTWGCCPYSQVIRAPVKH
ncbi:UNVERIFIED_CONTAM: hypothetical protein FKN15_072131 [Acipenser sinensis]